MDHLSDLRVYAGADELMRRVMEKLGLPIPMFVLRRRLSVKVETIADERHQLSLQGVDVDGTPVSFLKSARLEGNRRVAREEPFVINIRDTLGVGTRLKLELEFMGHYGEPNLEIEYEYNGESDRETLYLLEYSPHMGEWKTSKLNDEDVGDGTTVDVEKADGDDDDDSVVLLSTGSDREMGNMEMNSAFSV